MENIIIESKQNKALFVYSAIPFIIGLIMTICILCDGGLSAWVDYATEWGIFSIEALLSWGGLLLMILGVGLYLSCKSCKITVTNKKISGIAAFGTRVDIPIDSISSIGIVSLFKGISVASSSNKIKFLFVSNSNDIYSAISQMLMDRQGR